MSPQAAGSNSQILYDEEDVTFKTDPVVPDANILPFKTSDLSLLRNLFSSEAIASARNPKLPGRGNYEIGGAIALEMNPYIGTILKHLMGTNVDTGAPSAYTHTMKIGALPIALVFDVGFTDLAVPKYFKYNGCRINSFSVTFTPEGIVQASIDVLGAKETVGAAALDGTPNDLGHLPFDAFEVTPLEGSTPSAIAVLQEVTITIENNLDGSVYVLGGAGERRALPEGKVKVSGNIKALFEDDALYTKAIGHTESGLKITMSRGDGLGSAANESLELYVPELVYAPKSPAITGQEGVFLNLDFEGYYDDNATTSSFQIILKNSLATV